MVNSELSRRDLENFFNSRTEWLLTHPDGRTFAIQNSEIEISSRQDNICISFLDDAGLRTAEIDDFSFDANGVVLVLGEGAGRIRIVPRTLSSEFAAVIETARLERANEIAQILKEETKRRRIVRVELSRENGRFAQIITESAMGRRKAAIADVSGSLTPEFLVGAAVFWLEKLRKRKRDPIGHAQIIGDARQAKAVQRLLALLRDSWQERISVFELNDRKNAAGPRLIELPRLRLADLKRGKKKEVKPVDGYVMSETARNILEFAPDAVDVVFSRNGETLRFLGLPFARVRRVAGVENVWFGVESRKRIAAREGIDEVAGLVADIRRHRHADSRAKRHEFYRLAPEAWLEAVLRRNIKLLDPNLILSPVHHQFRAERDKIDLLALRRDGRLVIIELKVSPDREMILQAADYWRKIESERRAGNLARMRLFGDLPIADRPAIVYLAAPLLAFHPDFDVLANAVSREIEVFRFDLNENWREGIKVIRRIADPGLQNAE